MRGSICRPCAEALYATRLSLLQRQRGHTTESCAPVLQLARLSSPNRHFSSIRSTSSSLTLPASRSNAVNPTSSSLLQKRTYYSSEQATPPPYHQTETAILSASLDHVPKHGFTIAALTLGASDAGYLPASLNLLPHGGPYDLVLYHLVTSRLALKDTVQFPPEAEPQPSARDKLKTLIVARLQANVAYHEHLASAVALLTQPSRLPTSLNELGLLADEIVYLSGDVAVDSSWYTRRGGVAGIYAAAEVFMCQDHSVGFRETEAFVERRLDEAGSLEYAVDSVGEWLGYSAWSAVNVARSWGVRI